MCRQITVLLQKLYSVAAYLNMANKCSFSLPPKLIIGGNRVTTAPLKNFAYFRMFRGWLYLENICFYWLKILWKCPSFKSQSLICHLATSKMGELDRFKWIWDSCIFALILLFYCIPSCLSCFILWQRGQVDGVAFCGTIIALCNLGKTTLFLKKSTLRWYPMHGEFKQTVSLLEYSKQSSRLLKLGNYWVELDNYSVLSATVAVFQVWDDKNAIQYTFMVFNCC